MVTVGAGDPLVAAAVGVAGSVKVVVPSVDIVIIAPRLVPNSCHGDVRSGLVLHLLMGVHLLEMAV
jgi:hypothetical protein